MFLCIGHTLDCLVPGAIIKSVSYEPKNNNNFKTAHACVIYSILFYYFWLGYLCYIMFCEYMFTNTFYLWGGC